MSTKAKLLQQQLYMKYITGQMGYPVIPSNEDLNKTVAALNTNDIEPLFNKDKFTELNYSNLYTALSTIIDDISILYKSIDYQSKEILDQLTHSIKEYTGIKYELKRISNEVTDINNGSSTIDRIRYVFTENFESTKNINPYISHIDSLKEVPVIDVNAGIMNIPPNTLNVVDLSHYYGKKLNIIPSNYVGTIIKQPTYVGESDAAVIFDISNNKNLVYTLNNSENSTMKLSFIIQLSANNSNIEINGLSIQLDTTQCKGYLRIEYKDTVEWKNAPGVETVEIQNEFTQIAFSTSVKTSYIKISFLKKEPDDYENLTYNISIKNLSIYKSTNKKTATVISKSIKIQPYSFEKPVIATIGAEIGGYIPANCSANIYVAKDKLINGYYINSNNEYVDPQSNQKVQFIPAPSGTSIQKLTLLSDIIGQTNISGIPDFSNTTFDWKLLKSYKSDSLKPKLLNFINVKKKAANDNSLSTTRRLLFGDSTYNTIISGTYPQFDYPDISGVLIPTFLSGILEESNSSWYPLNLGVMFDINDIEYGGDYGSPISGFPFNYYDNNKMCNLVFNDYSYLLPGWYRKDTELVTPKGITNSVGDIDPVLIDTISPNSPEFYINNIKFYKIYRFEKNSEVVDTDINIYMYPTQQVNGNKNDYYPHNMIWNYKSKSVEHTSYIKSYATNDGSGIISIPISSDSEYIENSVTNLTYYDDNILLSPGRHYNVSGVISGNLIIDMSPSATDSIFIKDKLYGLNYSYNTIDKYKSYWNGYIIVDSETAKIKIIQKKDGSDNIINKYKIKNIKTNISLTSSVITGSNKKSDYSVLGDNNKEYELSRGIYECRFYCKTNKDSTPSKLWSPNSSSCVKVVGNARLVPEIRPLKVVSLETLLFTTTYEKDQRCSVITDIDNLQYVIVKEPSKNVLNGYYFYNTQNSYKKENDHLNKNIGHFNRRYINANNVIEKFTTGSKNTMIMSGVYGSENGYIKDLKWNNGAIYPTDFKNTDSNLTYPQHYTFGNPINIDDDIYSNIINSGHLFFNTAENLPAFYTIEYGLIDRNDPVVDRFLYKVDLISESDNESPTLDWIKFTMNTSLEEL